MTGIAHFKNGQYRFRKTGALYFARLRRDGIWLWKGEKPTATNYCGVQTQLDKFLSEFEKV